jgi:Tfp pilus assembly protein FimT
MRWGAERGVTLVELAVVLAGMAVLMGSAGVALNGGLASARARGATQDLYGALHLTKARARATGVMHALVIERGAFRIVEDPAGAPRTVVGPDSLGEGVVASGNTTIRFSPKGFAVPFGTITVTSGEDTRRLVVNILGRVRIERSPPH